MDDGRLIITDLFPVQFHEQEIFARPYEFNNLDNPTAILKSHTTCPDCGHRVEIDHQTDENFVEKDGIRYTYCQNCENGQYFFETLRQWIRGSTLEPEFDVPTEFFYDFSMVQTVDLINWDNTEFLFGDSEKPLEEIEKESVDDLIDAIVIEDE